MTSTQLMENVDRKFVIVARGREHDSEHSERDGVLFLAKDRALPATLRFYAKECARLGADARQLEGVRLLIERVETWQRLNHEVVKIADLDDNQAGNAVIEPNQPV